MQKSLRIHSSFCIFTRKEILQLNRYSRLKAIYSWLHICFKSKLKKKKNVNFNAKFVIIVNEIDADTSFALLKCLNTYWFHNWSQKTQAHIDMWIDSHRQYNYRHFWHGLWAQLLISENTKHCIHKWNFLFVWNSHLTLLVTSAACHQNQCRSINI